MQINLVATPEQPRVSTFNITNKFYFLRHVIDDFPSISPYNYSYEVVHYLNFIRPSLEQYFNRRLPLKLKVSLKYFESENEADAPEQSTDEAVRLAAQVMNPPTLDEIRQRYPYPHTRAYYDAYRRLEELRGIGLTMKLIEIGAAPERIESYEDSSVSNTSFAKLMRRTRVQLKRQLELINNSGSGRITGMIAKIEVIIAPHESLINLPQ